MLKDKKIHQELNSRFRNESDLTVSMMTRAISDLGISDPAALDVIYESVIFFTGDWPESEGWGSSDTSALIRSVKETLISNGYLYQDRGLLNHIAQSRHSWESLR